MGQHLANAEHDSCSDSLRIEILVWRSQYQKSIRKKSSDKEYTPLFTNKH